MFPTTNFNIETINDKIKQETTNINRSFLFDFSKNQTVVRDGKIQEVKNKEALKQWIESLLMIQQNKYEIYKNKDFGFYYNNYIGLKSSSLGYVKSELFREIREQLLKSRVIDSVENFNAELENDRLKISFTVILKNGEELEVMTVV